MQDQQNRIILPPSREAPREAATTERKPEPSAALSMSQTRIDDIEPGLRVIGTLAARSMLSLALAAATAEFPTIPKSKHVKFKSRKSEQIIDYWYATYANIRTAVDPALGKHGVACVAFPHSVDPSTEGYRVTTVLMGHGAEIWSTLWVPRPEEFDIKVLGTLFTYLRRYGVAAALGLEGDLDADELPADETAAPQLPARTQTTQQQRPAPRDQKPPPQREQKPAPQVQQTQQQPPAERESSPPPPQDKLWGKKEQDRVQELAGRLGYGTNPNALRDFVRGTLGCSPARDKKRKPLLSMTQATALIAALEAAVAELDKKTAPQAEEQFDPPNYEADDAIRDENEADNPAMENC